MAILRGKEAYSFYFGAKPEILRIAAELRKNMTPAEKVLWERIRNRQVSGYRFRRQHPIYEMVVDFFCYEAMLVIEVDGSVHEDSYQAERDVERTKILDGFGLKEIRFKNAEVMNNIDDVIRQIEKALNNP